MEKYCPQCNASKPSTSFHKLSRAADGLQRWCKECSKSRSQQYYADNKEKVIARKQYHKLNQQRRFEEWKSTLTCKCCNESDSCCLEFHHIDPSTKDDAISNMVYGSNSSWKKLMAEVNKCIVLCANCHRKLHKHKSLPLLIGETITV